MDSIYDLSKEKDVIRIMGRMPVSLLDRDPEEDRDILDRIYEVPIGTQEHLAAMLMEAGFRVTKGEDYTAVIISGKVSEEQMNSIPEGCKKIDVDFLAPWLADNKLVKKVYKYRKEESLPEETKVEGWRKFLLAIIFGIIALAVVYFGGAILLVVLLFVPGALTVFLRSFLK